MPYLSKNFWRFCLLLLCGLALVAAGYAWYSRSRVSRTPALPLAQTTIQMPTQQPMVLAVDSALPNLAITNLNHDRITAFVQLIGLQPEQGVLELATATRQPVQTITITVADVTTHPDPTSLAFVVTQNRERVIEGVAAVYDPTTQTMQYTLYLVPSVLATTPDRAAAYLSQRLMQLLFNVHQLPATAASMATFADQLRNFYPEGAQPLLRVTLPQQSWLIKKLQQLAHALTPAPVFAQSCGGFVECGWQQSASVCADGSVCDSVGFCENGIRCQTIYYCDYIPADLNCANHNTPACGGATQQICAGIPNPCWSEAPYVGGCYNPSNPEPTPEITPTPLPEPGSCGSACTTVSDCSIPGAQNPACSGGICWDAAACGNPQNPSSCTVSVNPSTLSLIKGSEPVQITATATAQNGTINRVEFEKSGQAVILAPTSDSSNPYQSYVHPVGVGTDTITARAFMNNGTTCTTTVPATVTFQ